jgi:hypothetical protein
MKKYLLAGILFCLVRPSSAQSRRSIITGIISATDSLNAKLGIEKLYVQTDKASYNAGDTLWFRAYLCNAGFFTAKSGLLYVEISNDSNRLIKRLLLPVEAGLASGQLPLSKEMPQGGYMLRAYTNWMRNFGEDLVFEKHFSIDDARDKDWLIDYSVRTVKDKTQLRLKFSGLDTVPVARREIRIMLSDGRRDWSKKVAETDANGMMNIDFDLPEKVNAATISLRLQDLHEGERKLTFPVLLNRPEDIDLQFMPEGGELVAGIPAHLAFKAIDVHGRGVSVTGKVYDSRGSEVAVFASAHRGIGVFDLLPAAGETYSARIDLPDGSARTYPLPAVKNAGTTLQVINPFQSDSLEVDLSCRPAPPTLTSLHTPMPTPTLASAPASTPAAGGDTCFLLGEARGKVCYGAWVDFRRGNVKLLIPKNAFPSGIARFVLSRANGLPLNERLVFIDHHDNLAIHIRANKDWYRQRDSVALHIEVTDKTGQPVQGHFSLAVTDNGQVRTDSIAGGSLLTHLLLTAELSGTVEDPGYYFPPTADKTIWRDLDQLLLAQGWVGYNWNAYVQGANPFNFPVEKAFLVRGKVSNAFNKPVAHTEVTLLSRKPLMLLDAVTNERGDFVFTGISPSDTMTFFLQARNRKGKSSNVEVGVDEFKPPVFAPVRDPLTPWYVNVDTGSLWVINRNARLKKDEARITGEDMLQAVVVKARRVIVGSKNLNGPGEADLLIGEGELEKAGKTTLGDLLQKDFPGFRLSVSKQGARYYSINAKVVHLVIDGTNIEFLMPEGIQQADYFKQYLDYYTAEDIKGIELMESQRYVVNYMTGFLGPFSSPDAHAFIEITTRGGQGPFLTKTAGTLVYRPMGFTLAKAFYSPKYAPDSKADMTDIRSTIFWEPDIRTDKDGQATVKFYTADNPGSYSLILEGCDMQGGLGAMRTTLFVRNP